MKSLLEFQLMFFDDDWQVCESRTGRWGRKGIRFDDFADSGGTVVSFMA